MFKAILKTDSSDYSLLILRVILWIIFFAHWAQKAFWWFGGNWFDKTMDFFVNSFWIPWIIAFLVVFIETIWAVFLILWLQTRLASFWIFVVMIWAIWLIHLQNGLFLSNWWYEYNLLIMAVSLALMYRWWWAYSLDSLVFNVLDNKNMMKN